MHELPIAQQVLDISLRHADKNNASEITNIYIIIGQLSSILDESIQFYWGMIAEGTIAEKAELHFRRIPALLKCLACEKEYGLNDNEMACPECNGEHFIIIAGKEFNLEAIDINS